MIPVIARIAARYIAGALITYGLLDVPEARGLEPDLALLIGAGIGAVAEGGYALAKRRGWMT